MPIPQPYKQQQQQQHQYQDEHQIHQHWRPPRPVHPQGQPQMTRADSPSLLAKRLGPTRAAELAMPAIHPSSTQGQWRQTPPLAQQQQRTQAQGMPACPVTPELPSTPTWLPRLTPTRRGDDLFLNVG